MSGFDLAAEISRVNAAMDVARCSHAIHRCSPEQDEQGPKLVCPCGHVMRWNDKNDLKQQAMNLIWNNRKAQVLALEMKERA